MTKVKICGLRREADIAYANAYRPDYVGFVFAPTSRRYISPSAAGTLCEKLDAGIEIVGVFVDTPPEEVAALLNRRVIDVAQLHGHEDEAYLKALHALTDRPLIKAFRIENEADVARANASVADHVLLDHGAGGTGRTFDWSLLHGMARPYFLAGGLTVKNIANALRLANPAVVDTSSGVETDGFKDPSKIERFIATVRNCG